MNPNQINVCGDDGVCFKMSSLLHRYHKVDQYLIGSLIYNYLWFSDPLDFNDPYDCNLDLIVSNSTLEEIYDYLQEENKKNNYGQTDSSIRERANYLFSNIAEMQDLMKSADEETIKEKGICCFSEKDNSLLMWSHYADKHKGICMTFDVYQDEALFKDYPYKVEYPITYPIYNWPRDRGTFNSLKFLIATKSKEWEYENEIRIVRDFNNAKEKFRGRIDFNKKALVAIKFGLKTLESNQINIKAILEKTGGYEHVRFYKAKLKQFEFGMEYEAIFI